MATTIKVSEELRDRVNLRAREAGVSASRLIENLMDERERWERMAEFGRAIRGADAEYWDEFRAWDVTLADGLD